MSSPLRTDNLTKTYNPGRKNARVALDSLSLEAPQGTIFGFLGPNGAGKTTTIKMILDFIRPTGGSVTIFGEPAGSPATRRRIGYLPEQPYFHKFLKPVEVVSMHAALAGIDRRDVKSRALTSIERAGIAEYRDIPISKLSKGLTQRVGIAQAIVGNPDLLILDEPTSGLDPIGRRHTRDLLLRLRDEGKTIFLSSHLLSEIEDICDIVAVLKDGKLMACGAPDSIKRSGSQAIVRTGPIDKEMHDRLRFLDVVIEQRLDGALLKIDPKNIYEVMRAMEELRMEILDIQTERESLEEAFLRLAA
jgi:ABC-2 type transport system ATP-binding protein